MKLSGNKAMKSCSNQEAFRYYKDAIGILKEEPETAENKRELLDVILLMGVPMEYLSFPEDSLTILHEGERLCKDLGDTKSLANLHSSIGIFHILKGDPVLARRYQEDAFQEAKRIGDIEIMARIASGLCAAYQVEGGFEKIRNVALEVISLLEKTHRQHDSFGLSLNAYSHLQAICGAAMGTLGEFTEGERLCEKGLSFAHEISHPFSTGSAELLYGVLLVQKGDGANAVKHLQSGIECFEESKAHTFLPLAWGCLGSGYRLLGKLDSALAFAQKGLKMQEESGQPFYLSLHHFVLSTVHLDLGNVGEARLHVQEGLNLARANHEKSIEGQAWITLGRAIGKTDASQFDTAEKHIIQGMNVADELETKPSYATGCLALGELYAGAGQKEKARENLAKAQAMFEEMGMDYYLLRTKKLLETLDG